MTRIANKLRKHTLEQQQAELLRTALAGATEDAVPITPGHRIIGADARHLRGIPVIGHGGHSHRDWGQPGDGLPRT
jgi:hypothetical protein